MSDIELLDRIRTVNGLLRKNQEEKVVFTDICNCLGRLLSADAVVLSRKGKVLGKNSRRREGGMLPGMLSVGERVEETLNNRLLTILSTQEGVNPELMGLKDCEDLKLLVTPVEMKGLRLGTLMVCRKEQAFSIEDIILCEYADTVLSLEMLRSETEEYEAGHRRERTVRDAFAALSYSEALGVISVLEELKGYEGTVIASRIAENIGITRPVVVNGLKKLESAGVIETGSAGMKGTRIRVKSPEIYEEAEKWKESRR